MIAVCLCTGSIPDTWLQPGALPALSNLLLSYNALTGSLPETWGSNGSFQSMVLLELGEVGLFGTLPEWSTPGTFQHLESLVIAGCNITGALMSA